MAALEVITSKNTQAHLIPTSDNACCHCPLLAHAEMAALKLITLRVRPDTKVFSNRDNACSHCPLLSHAEMAASKIITSKVTPAFHTCSRK